MTDQTLPSWNSGPTRDAIVAFLDRVDEIPPEHRVSVFDNDGTMWAEKPNYTQIEFWLLEMQEAIAADPSLADTPEFRAVIDHDMARIEALGLEGLATAFLDLFAGMTPEEFDAKREYAYESKAGTFDAEETILDTADRLGWTVASIKNDWATVFPDS